MRVIKQGVTLERVKGNIVAQSLPNLRYVRKIRLVLHSDDALRLQSNTLSRLLQKK